METMDYDFYGTKISSKEFEEYREGCINKLFAILPIFEECSKSSDLTGYYTYLNRVVFELSGVNKVFGANAFLTIIGILTSMMEDKNPTKKVVKALTFHCISVLKKRG